MLVHHKDTSNCLPLLDTWILVETTEIPRIPRERSYSSTRESPIIIMNRIMCSQDGRTSASSSSTSTLERAQIRRLGRI